MTTTSLPQMIAQTESPAAAAVRDGLTARRKNLPAWMFYDADGSRLFDEITALPEYYLTRTERGILSRHADEIVGLACCEGRLRVAELGAGSADKTRLVLKAATDRQGTLLYEPIDVSESALEEARERVEREIPGVTVLPQVTDYTEGLYLEAAESDERRLLLYIGSSIGNFEPGQAAEVLDTVRSGLEPGDALLLGVDMRKDEATLVAAYDDAAGVTARFNLNILARLNKEMGADFDLESFAHRAVWNEEESRIEMHLESLIAQSVRIPSLDLEIEFDEGERIHTENSYKYAPGQAEALLAGAGFAAESTWNDERGWFTVCLARVE
jgi:L-histidine Nalpha-methyltransferase